MTAIVSARLASLVTPLMEENVSNWSLTTFLNKLTTQLGVWGGLLVTLVGLVMLIVGIFKVAKALMSKSGDNNWVLIVALLLVGGALMAGGLSMVIRLANLGNNTLNEMGAGGEGTATLNAIVPFLSCFSVR